MKKNIKPTVLIILDGWGLAKKNKGNAIALAKTPNFDKYWRDYPHAKILTYGPNAGLPDMQEGNSEAGHENLGAGRVVKQDSVYINDSIIDGTFFKNTAFLEAIKHLKKYKTRMHLMGLLSNEVSAHAYPDHIYALLELAKRYKIDQIFLHLFTDGRDSSQHAAIEYLKKLANKFKNGEKVASLTGRAYAMDRKKDWHKIKKVYEAIVLGRGEKSSSPSEAILRAYNRGDTDEFVEPTVIMENKKPVALISDNDIVFFFNLRSDRARELTKALVQADFETKNSRSFKRVKPPKNIRFVAMTDFGPDLPHVLTAFPRLDIDDSLPIVLKDLRQLYVAEDEKYAHVTYFFNGGYADSIAGEKRIRVPSPDVKSYDEKPAMSAYEVADKVIKNIVEEKFDFITVNFANPDMIGHTGNLEAGIKACEIIDELLGNIVTEVRKKKGNVVITADHGNIEEMINLETNEISTTHTKNPVPLIVISDKSVKLSAQGNLSNVAPTLLDLMNIKKPQAMTGKSLIK
jgi:2,3-bisphosphoglycerate-independent phosphoglycerate mutase